MARLSPRDYSRNRVIAAVAAAVVCHALVTGAIALPALFRSGNVEMLVGAIASILVVIGLWTVPTLFLVFRLGVVRFVSLAIGLAVAYLLFSSTSVVAGAVLVALFEPASFDNDVFDAFASPVDFIVRPLIASVFIAAVVRLIGPFPTHMRD